jgi:UPF0755 protein
MNTVSTPERPGKFMKKLLAIGSALVVLGLGIAVSGIFIIDYLDRPTGSIAADGIEFTIRPGESGSAIGRRLREAGMIKSEDLFRLLLKTRRMESSLKAGTYRVLPGMSGSDIADLMVSGVQLLVKVSVTEGSGLKAIATAAASAGVAAADAVFAAAVDAQFIASLGIPATSLLGYLYPDTYLLPKNAGAEALLRMMVDTFMKRLKEHLPEATALSPGELHRYVTLASIVEREYRIPDEAPLMAGVFWNRLRIGMALQSCATVVYVITENLGKPHPARLFDRDLKIDDPFNTYLFPGLPPAPICNPGIIALKAAFRPTATRFLYFRLIDESTGRHYFSETLDEHIRAGSLTIKPRS